MRVPCFVVPISCGQRTPGRNEQATVDTGARPENGDVEPTSPFPLTGVCRP